MSQDYNSRYQQIKDNDPTAAGTAADMHDQDRYTTHSLVRNICFVRADKTRFFLNYAYLVAVDEAAPDALLITFTSHTVLLKGFRLAALFDDLMTQVARIITCTAGRYNALADSGQPVVSELVITSHS